MVQGQRTQRVQETPTAVRRSLPRIVEPHGSSVTLHKSDHEARRSILLIPPSLLEPSRTVGSAPFRPERRSRCGRIHNYDAGASRGAVTFYNHDSLLGARGRRAVTGAHRAPHDRMTASVPRP